MKKKLLVNNNLFDIGINYKAYIPNKETKFLSLRNWNFIILLFLLLFFTPSLFAVDLVVVGAADANANGTYTPQSGTTWKHSSKEYYIYKYRNTDDKYYWIFDTKQNFDGTFIAACDATTSTSPARKTMDAANGGCLNYSMTIAEYSATPEINITGNGITINSGAPNPVYTDYTNFGTAVTGGGTATRTFTIQNTGASALSVGAISFSGSSDFSVTTAPQPSVAALGSTTFTVTFTPSAVGNRTATISIGNNDSNESPYTFAISGYGFITKDLIVSGSITPSDANGTYKYAGIKNDFPYWKHSMLNYYIVSNPATSIGTDPTWALDNNFLTSDGYPFYCYSAANVPTGLTWSTLSFLPTGASSNSSGAGTLSVTDVTTVPEINIKGGSNDIVNGSSVIDFYHHTNFGTLNIASGSKIQSFTIENKGTGTLTLNGTSPYVTLSGTNASEFTVSSVPSNSIIAGGTTTFAIKFDPSTVGTKTAVVNISNNDGDEGSYSFNIQGEAITPKSIIVSNITAPTAANGTYTYQGITNDFESWKNSSGYYIYNYRQGNADESYDPYWYIDANNSVIPSDATTYNFSASSSNGAIVSPTNISSWSASAGSTGTPTIMFAEPEINIVGNSLNIVSGDNTPSEYDYTDLGWVASGSVTKTFTIQNLGTETLTLTGASPYITITNPTNFSIATAPAASIPAGGSTTFQVTCTPSASLGTYSATLSIANNDANENPYNFSIQGGKGTLPTVTSQPVSDIGTITAIGNGTITSLGNPNPSAYGICYGTAANPDITGSKVDKGTASVTGAFTAAITGLSLNTTYYVRAYVKNNVGLVYGPEQTFKTLLPTITSVTYDESAGILALTCTNISSGDVINPAKITITGEGGTTYTLTTGNATASSSTAASITLNATDKVAINLILNKNSTSSTSGTIYNVAAADDWDANITAGDISDLSGNGITVSNVAVPTITSAAYDASTGVLTATGTGFFKLSGAANDINISRLTVTGEGGATYTFTTSNVDIVSSTSFSVTLNATDKAAVNQIVNKNGTSSTGGTTYNLAAAEDWENGADAAVVVADLTGNSITVSNVAVPTISSSTYDAVTGVLAVTGTGFLKSNGAANDINVSKFTITGEGGATYTLTTTGVEISSGTTFTATLNASDKSVLNQIINKNGTASTGGTTYNLAAAEDWSAGADAAVVVADLTGNGITVNNVVIPTITSATYDAGTGTLSVTGTGFLKLNGASNDINVSKLTITGEGGATYTLTTANVEIITSTMFTVALNAADRSAINQIFNKNGTASTSGAAYNLAAAEDWSAGADAAVVVADLTGNGITVSNVVIPTITSATYDAATGTLSVTGTGFIKLNGASNDINVSKLSIKGEGNANYTLTTSDVEISSGTSFAITLNATDKFAVTQIINKNGSVSNSGTAYNLAANEDWAAGMDPLVVVADLTGNGIMASNITAPGAPTIGIVTPENTQASVSFTAPASNGGSAITGYTVVSSPGGRIGSGSSSPITVTGLTNGTAYTFTVTATNSVGTSAPSTASNSVTPNASQSITFTNPGAQTFGTTPTLSATASSNLAVTFSTSTPDVCTITSGGTLTFIKAGTCTILANQAGNTAYTAAPIVSQTFTVNAVVPEVPTIATATAGDTQATVNFIAPTFTGGSTITGYTVTSSPGGITATGTASPIIVTGLTNGTAYTFTVTATNSAGTSAPSTASNSVTPNASQSITFTNPGAQTFGATPTLTATASSSLAVTFSTSTPEVCTITSSGTLTFIKAGTCTILADQAGNAAYTTATTISQTFTVNAVVPEVPTIATATAGDTQATVNFTAPTFTGGSTITGYTVTSSIESVIATGTTSPITVTGLTNGTAYTFTVTATNVAGTSTASVASNGVTPHTLPTATTYAATDITSSGVTLNGTINANGASTAVTFEYGTTIAYGTSVAALQSPTSGILATSVSKALTGLISNTTYHYRVVGVNEAGTTDGLDQTFTTALGTGLDNPSAAVLSLYPNPATEGFYINVGEKKTLISIFDLNGSLVFTQQVIGKSYINITQLQKGVYVVKTNGLVAKLVKK